MYETKICRYCGQVIDGYAENCEFCGKYVLKKYDNSGLHCSQCKAEVNTDDNFCQYCGAIFNIPPSGIIPDNKPPEKHNNDSGIHYNILILITSLAISATVAFLKVCTADAAFGVAFLYFCITFIISEILLYIYFLPSIIAFKNNNSKMYLIYICNLLFGITIIGWFVFLTMALSSDNKRE